MNTQVLAAVIIIVSVASGAFASISYFGVERPIQGETYSSGEVHEHALFHIVKNGTEAELWRDRYQLRSEAVHLENNKSDIVHKHRSGVTWGLFLETIDVEVWKSNSTGNLCVKYGGKANCGDGKLVMNGEELEDLDQLDKEIRQDDHLLIIQDTEEMESLIRDYMKKQLPPEYRPQSVRGRSV